MSILINNTSFKKAMFLKGYNLSDLSKELGIGISYLSAIANGKKIPSPKLAKNIANVLDVEIKDLFYFEEKEAQ
ncbi:MULTISPECIES: helix-turn-helix transcriptional regulator [Staphylococcus]|uniref:helix-turn-helix transcriptional regulator n=1 Tax=Staphylococcus TaxID=1279 RepID=UPI00066EED39|nr:MULTISPECIES: helix-turn-helix transcriptional regulator [Staphylococcus]MBC2966877.1 helix-turn-helix transcriptional regulator [Staphylococcus epidermidis]MBC3111040.1 helix-turn-helix transcriptional regulator [Staphylococcus epidermidis]MBM0753077.1 XRE family transcriptional regulator [Staphylococcus epidermidis]MBM0765282.1 XRE family transcriptional regulator [Staphylococcus epidermidis]MBM0800923.1 XRE family transcriptional regulator [Staphylococcus epidermidis]